MSTTAASVTSGSTEACILRAIKTGAPLSRGFESHAARANALQSLQPPRRMAVFWLAALLAVLAAPSVHAAASCSGFLGSGDTCTDPNGQNILFSPCDAISFSTKRPFDYKWRDEALGPYNISNYEYLKQPVLWDVKPFSVALLAQVRRPELLRRAARAAQGLRHARVQQAARSAQDRHRGRRDAPGLSAL